MHRYTIHGHFHRYFDSYQTKPGALGAGHQTVLKIKNTKRHKIINFKQQALDLEKKENEKSYEYVRY